MRIYGGQRSWEGSQIAWLRQLGHKILGIDVHAHLALPRGQVHVEASLEALLHKVLVARNEAQSRVLLRNKVDSPLVRLLLLPLLLLLLVEQVSKQQQ